MRHHGADTVAAKFLSLQKVKPPPRAPPIPVQVERTIPPCSRTRGAYFTYVGPRRTRLAFLRPAENAHAR